MITHIITLYMINLVTGFLISPALQLVLVWCLALLRAVLVL